MSSKRDIIVFGEDWAAHPSSSQHLIKKLVEHDSKRKIIWVNSIGLRRPKFNLSDIKRLAVKLFRGVSSVFFSGLFSKSLSSTGETQTNDTDKHSRVNAAENLIVRSLLTLPAPQSRLGKKIAAALLRQQFYFILKKYKLQRPIVWTSLPTASEFFNRDLGLPIVYYCGDDFSALAGVDHKTAQLHEKNIAKHSSLIITASDKLKHKFCSDKTKLLTHGVDYELFAKQKSRSPLLPNNGKPTIGFYGSLSEWIDTELISKTAKLRPDWNFLLIGNSDIELKELHKIDNIFVLGAQDHHTLCHFSQHWQASLLPFKDNKQIRSCNPLKLKEYLAAGQPVISTPFPALNEYKSHVFEVNNAEQLSCLLEAMQQAQQQKQKKALEIKQARQQSVQHESWSSKAFALDQWLLQL
ncbi:glycosyltransferase [Agaribacterium haliotis]|uniref:glycosyltransferase n=1 Tax=Agaribacterium haliotis TaxID=2013869 RepID=UPI000BB56ABA|nr:glycosyltransferase [Agaribacterium haliotis]